MAVAVAVGLALLVGVAHSAETTMDASDDRVVWSGRTLVDAGAVQFDWLGVTARVSVTGATYVTANITTTATVRGTRLKAYMSDQGFNLYPEVQFWVSPVGSSSHVLFASNGPRSTMLTLENIVSPQYGTGITTVVSFSTDGVFVAPTQLPTGKIEFIGDSITAATNVVRPEGAPHCGDGGYQSDWSQTYEGLLCHRFNADCSTIAVGGKCMMRECGGLQMPDYYLSQFYADAPKPTHDFAAGWKPDAIFINLGTNDNRVIPRVGADHFVDETLAFMKNATVWYSKPDIDFFLSAGPMENITLNFTQNIVVLAQSRGMKATFVDMTTACADARLHAPDDSDGCDGCASHPGIEGHRGMYEDAWPVMSKTMGWTADRGVGSKPGTAAYFSRGQ